MALVSSPLFYVGRILRKSYIYVIWDSIRIKAGEVISGTCSITRLHNIYRWLRLIKFVTPWFEVEGGKEDATGIRIEMGDKWGEEEKFCARWIPAANFPSRGFIRAWKFRADYGNEENRTEWWGCPLEKRIFFIQDIVRDCVDWVTIYTLLSLHFSLLHIYKLITNIIFISAT